MRDCRTIAVDTVDDVEVEFQRKQNKPDNICVGKELPLLLLEPGADDAFKERAKNIVLKLVFGDGDAFELLHHIGDFVRTELFLIDAFLAHRFLVVTEVERDGSP